MAPLEYVMAGWLRSRRLMVALVAAGRGCWGLRPHPLPRQGAGTTLLVAAAVPHNLHMTVHTLEDEPENTGHLLVHQRGGPARLKEHLTAHRSWASTVNGAEVRLHDQPLIRPDDTLALSVDGLTPGHPDVK